MGFNCGIVGLPNVGKSTLFNALTETAAAEAANYPFCTIEPNTGRVAVPDPRLDALAALAQSQNIIPTQLEFVDIAGLVRGASKGEGLGNQFLGNIRGVDAIAHVLRCFEESDITHVDGDVDPALIVSDGIDMTRRETCFFRVVSTRVLFREPQTMPMVWVGNKGTTTDFKSSPDFTTLQQDTVRDHFDRGRFLSAIKGMKINCLYAV